MSWEFGSLTMLKMLVVEDFHIILDQLERVCKIVNRFNEPEDKLAGLKQGTDFCEGGRNIITA
jgi:hypothetical protein